MNPGSTRMRSLLIGLVVAAALAVAIYGWAQTPTAPAGQTAATMETSPIALGPYVQNVGTNNATICWATLAGRVNHPATQANQTTTRAYDHHSVLLRYLKPATDYTYDVLRDGSDLGKGSFTTAPDGEQPFRFVVYGDARPTDAHRRLIPRVIGEKPVMVFNTGDLMSDGLDIFDWESYFGIAGPLMRNIPLYPVLGNHENDSKFYFEFFSLPGNERYYSFNRGPVHFVGLDTAGPDIPPTNQAMTKVQGQQFDQQRREYMERQLAWLKDDLAGFQDAKYIFVFFHHPLVSIKASRVQGAKAVRAMFGTIFQDYGVSAVFNGHDHHYHRYAIGGVRFITTGAGGASLYDTDAPQPETIKYAKVAHYVRLDVGSERVAAAVIDADGNAIDTFEIPPRAAPAAAAK